MGILKLKYSKQSGEGEGNYCLPLSDFQKFNASILELGDISKDGEYFEALAAVFDLEGFTTFCTQIDPHLVIPEFLTEFLNWLFESISKEFLQKTEEEQIVLWCQTPFYAKFMGDGVLFLWDTRGVDLEAVGNIVVSLGRISRDYGRSFLPRIKKRVARSPQKLRCGIARGQIISIGDGRDFVGPCINVASRLQKLGQFSFAFSKRGFNLERCFSEDFVQQCVLIKSSIRGIGEEELVYVIKHEFDLLSDEEKTSLLP